MELSEAIANPRINAFDIWYKGSKLMVTTYHKPGESAEVYQARHNRNYQRALQLTAKK